MATLKYVSQYFLTTLNVGGGIDASQTTGIVLQSVSGVTDITKPGQICVSYSDPIDTAIVEWIDYTSINGSNELQGVTRGREGFSAHTHLQNATVAFVVSASHFNDISTGLAIGGVFTNGVTTTLDEDTMSSNSATALATQQSIKAYADTKMTNPMTTQGDVVYGGASGAPTRLAKGTAAQVLAMNSGATAPEWATPTASALTSKVIGSTRDMTAASGDVSYTGVGFVPTAITIMGYIEAGLTFSMGFADSAKTSAAIGPYGSLTMTGGSNVVSAFTGAGANQLAIVKTYDADGLTLTWTKNGSPTGTLILKMICFK